MKKITEALFGSKHDRTIAKLKPVLEKINALEEQTKKMSDGELREKTAKFKELQSQGASDSLSNQNLVNSTVVGGETDSAYPIRNQSQEKEKGEDFLPEAFAIVREAAVRSLGLRLYDVQLVGAMVLNQGKIAEMKTGEGKTLTATAAVFWNALKGKGVHVVTVNDYLAKRDADWMRPVYEMLGMSVGMIQSNMPTEGRCSAYDKDITYGTNNEFGFDYLRDNMISDKSQRVQRDHFFAIVDEVDSILIDEARTPLIISGAGQERTEEYRYINQIMERFVLMATKAPPPPEKEVMPGKEEPHVIRGFYYDIDEKGRNVFLTEEGIQYLETKLKIENLYAPEFAPMIALIQQSLKAYLIFQKEVDYVVQKGEVLIVDEHTGRTLTGRRYGEGLHQSIEAKERVPIRQESQTMASITFQNYFRLYQKLAGMTGTAETEAEEFRKIYGLEIVVIPTHVPMVRKDFPDRVYANEPAKFKAIVNEVVDCMKRKQPVLLGTISIEKSEELSELLLKRKVPHSVLNAKHHSQEAEIIANAGALGRVTVATNMAGRGTDIVLGSSPQYLAKVDVILLRLENQRTATGSRSPNADPNGDAEHLKVLQKMRTCLLQKNFAEAEACLQENDVSLGKLEGNIPAELATIFSSAKKWSADHEKVKQSGGLHIIGTERHDARRIDNQLRGRSGRQGDPGSSRFYLSLEDPLMRIFGGERIRSLMNRMGMGDDQELEARMVDKAIARAQKRVESHHFDVRKHLLDYDEVMNTQRGFVYVERNRILEQKQLRPYLLQWMEDAFEVTVAQYCPTLEMETWDLQGLSEWMAKGLRFPEKMTWLNIEEIHQAKSENPQKMLLELCFQRGKEHYENKVQHYEENGFPDFSIVERRIALDVLDLYWKEHLRSIDHLREGVWASGYAERNPLVEFKLESFKLFDQMIEVVKIQITEYLFCVQLQKEPQSNASMTRQLDLESAKADVASNQPVGIGFGNKTSNQLDQHQHQHQKENASAVSQGQSPKPATMTVGSGSSGSKKMSGKSKRSLHRGRNKRTRRK